MRGSSKRSSTARCCPGSASRQNELAGEARRLAPADLACAASAAPPGPRRRKRQARLRGDRSSIRSASASSTRCAAPSTRWRRGSPLQTGRKTDATARSAARGGTAQAGRGDRRRRAAGATDRARRRLPQRDLPRSPGNSAIEEMIAPQWPHMRRSMATVLAELDYRGSAWTEHETIAAHIFPATPRPRRPRRWRMRRRPDG